MQNPSELSVKNLACIKILPMYPVDTQLISETEGKTNLHAFKFYTLVLQIT